MTIKRSQDKTNVDSDFKSFIKHDKQNDEYRIEDETEKENGNQYCDLYCACPSCQNEQQHVTQASLVCNLSIDHDM